VGSLQLSLSSLAGTAIAYVSARTPQPNASSAQYVLGGLGAASLTLHPLADSCVATATCFYYLSVMPVAYGGSAAVFRLQATSSAIIPLSLGIPASGVTGPGSFVYYSVYVPPGSASGLTFVAQALSGGFIGLYVTNTIDATTGLTVLPHIVCTAPAPGTGTQQVCESTTIVGARWGSAGNTARARVSIPATHAYWRNGTNYVLAITAAYPGTEFTITPRLGNDAVTISSGSPINDKASAAGATFFYRVIAPANASFLTIQAMPYSGDIKLVVCADASIDPRPDAASLARATEHSALGLTTSYARRLLYFTADVANNYRVDVPWEALTGCAIDSVQRLCTLSVGVTAVSPGTFALVTSPTVARGGSMQAAAQGSASRLVSGQVALGAVSAGQLQFFYLPLRNVVAWGATYWVSVVELVGESEWERVKWFRRDVTLLSTAGSTRVYASSDGSFPTRTAYQQTSPTVAGVQLISYSPATPGYNPIGTLIVAVYGFTGAVFSVSAGMTGSLVELLVSRGGG
jgi:hypothetical protein